MTIAYLPSEGKINKVGITNDNLWYGDSVGGAVVEKIKVNSFGRDYFSYVKSNLSSTSRWFFKDITDYNFLNGITVYRCMYIGADTDSKEIEVLGNINCSITHNGPAVADDTVEMSICHDGKFTAFTSINSTNLGTEFDEEGLLSARNDWASSITYNQPLNPGEYLKVWIKIKFKLTPTLTDIKDYIYFATIKGITIPMYYVNGRLSTSKLFSMSLNSDTYILKEVIPGEFIKNNIYKVVDKGNILNILYKEDDNLKMLLIKTAEDPKKCKYVSVNVNSFIDNLYLESTFLPNFNQCKISTPSTSATSGSPGTTGTSGTTDGDIIVEYPESPNTYNDVIGNKYMVDIIPSGKKDRMDFYLFFNTFITNTTAEEEERYGYKNYFWKTGLLHIDLNYINDFFFESLEEGYENAIVGRFSPYEYNLSEKFYLENVTIKEDLIIGVGHIPEDCRVDTHISKMMYIWEGDIVNKKVTAQITNIPSVSTTKVNTVPNITETEASLIFDDANTNMVNFGFKRSIQKLPNGMDFIHMGPAAQKAFHHGLSPVTFDVVSDKMNDYSSTWSFGISPQSVLSRTVETTGSPSCELISSNPTTGVSTTASPDTLYFDALNPNHMHVKTSEHYNLLISQQISVGKDTSMFVNKNVSIFNIHCIGDESVSLLRASYNFNTSEWTVSINKESGESIDVILYDADLLLYAENTITVNMFKHLTYGCAKKYAVNVQIFANGKEIFNGISYIRYTNDILTITHNNNRDFSGWISYWEIKKYIEKDVSKYATAMFQILSNIAWAEFEDENVNTSESENIKMFNFKKNILIRNLTWGTKESIVIPIVLQGNGYNISDEINEEVRRSVFPFDKINTNNPSFAFTLEGSSKTLEWITSGYDIDRDIMVIWVRIDNWSGQRITMYYSDARIINDSIPNRPYRDDWIAVWHMNSIIQIPETRYTQRKLHKDSGNYISVTDLDGNNHLVEIDKHFVFGFVETYMSNKFDINWNDSSLDKKSTDLVNGFIRNHVAKFKPSFMEIRNIQPLLPYKVEVSNNSSLRPNANNGNIVVQKGPQVICR